MPGQHNHLPEKRVPIGVFFMFSFPFFFKKNKSLKLYLSVGVQAPMGKQKVWQIINWWRYKSTYVLAACLPLPIAAPKYL